MNNGEPLGAPSRMDDNIPYFYTILYPPVSSNVACWKIHHKQSFIFFPAYEPFIYRGFCSAMFDYQKVIPHDIPISVL